MAKETFLPYISVQTLPNGYSLEFEGMKQANGYLYLSKEKLLKGFMAHIGLEVTDQLNMETVDDFLVAAINWRDNKACVKEIQSLTAALRIVKGRRAALANNIIKERNRYIAFLEEIRSFRSTLKDHPDGKLLKAFDKLLKGYKEQPRLTLKSLGVNAEDFIEEETDEEEDDV